MNIQTIDKRAENYIFKCCHSIKRIRLLNNVGLHSVNECDEEVIVSTIKTVAECSPTKRNST